MGSFAELIDYDAMFAEIERQQKLKLSTDQTTAIKEIVDEELKRRANPGIGKSLGATATNWIYAVFSFIQNIFKGFRLKDPLNSTSSAADATGTKLDAHMRDESTTHIYLKMKENPLIADLAEEVSGQYPASQANEIPSTPPIDNVFGQITKKRGIPGNTSSSLAPERR